MAAWSVACIDEPFGQLDRANAKSLSAHLHAMIRGSFAFRQGFIVAHDQSIMEALPARVKILANEQGSRLEVG
jgi:DNA repair exonuclease SbcCD ATPase subunit